MFKKEDETLNAIVVVGFNRLNSILRLLNSLVNAKYEEKVPLVISIDKSDNEELYHAVYDFDWPYGNKYVIIQPKRCGLKEHIYKCGDLSRFFKSVTILEDDLVVSPFFYKYICRTVEKYGENPNVAGISLYRNEYNGFNGLPLYFLNVGYDVFAYQSTSTWGETFTYKMWSAFRRWLSDWEEDFSSIDMYLYIKGWGKAWSKYYEAYIIEQDKYFIYPYLSLSTNNNDAGTHVTQSDNTYQTELLFGNKSYALPDFDNLVKYDTYAQCELLKSHLDLDNIAIDLNGNRENLSQFDYLLSIRHLDYKVIKSFGAKLRPIELNVLMDVHGNDIFLYDTHVIKCNHYGKSVKKILSDYYLRDFNHSLLLNKAYRNSFNHIKLCTQRFWKKLKMFTLR